MQTCPHCHSEIKLRELRHQGMWKNYRLCSACGGAFTVDSATRTRQAMFIVVAVVSLVFTLFLYFVGTQWLLPALVSYGFLAGLVYWGNKHVTFVPYESETGRRGGGSRT